LINQLNTDDSVTGFFVQLPLPHNFNKAKILSAISPQKDVDGFHPLNVGKLLLGEEDGFVPCTPLGILRLLQEAKISPDGQRVVIVGRSNIVGKPAAMMLLEKNATVTVCHSRTKNISEFTKKADILVVAVGKPKLITKEMIKEGAIVIDVGINRVGDKLVGDVDFESVKEVAGFITPVPGGVGPMTRAMLMENTLKAMELGRKFSQ